MIITGTKIQEIPMFTTNNLKGKVFLDNKNAFKYCAAHVNKSLDDVRKYYIDGLKGISNPRFKKIAQVYKSYISKCETKEAILSSNIETPDLRTAHQILQEIKKEIQKNFYPNLWDLEATKKLNDRYQKHASKIRESLDSLTAIKLLTKSNALEDVAELLHALYKDICDFESQSWIEKNGQTAIESHILPICASSPLISNDIEDGGGRKNKADNGHCITLSSSRKKNTRISRKCTSI